MKLSRLISTILLFSGLVSSALADSTQGQSEEKHGNSEKQDKQDRPEKNGKQKEQKAAPQGHSEQQQQRSQREEQPREKQNQQATKYQQQVQVVQQPQQVRPRGWDKGKKVGWGNGNVPPGKQVRYSPERQGQLISEQQQRVVVYRQHLDQQEILGRTYSAQLQQDKRVASYRFQQEYLARLRQQQLTLQRSYNYNNDPYFYTASTYRYNRDGSFYETNQYGADTLRKAINFGYTEGFRSGQADMQDRYTSGYQNSYAYQDANYGYDGHYGDQDSYNYYFRQGFSRGYEDGYNSRSQYGSYSNGNYSVLGNILSGILSLQALR